MAVERHVVELRGELALQPISKRRQPLAFFVHHGAGHLAGFAEAYDARHVQRPGPQTALLAAPIVGEGRTIGWVAGGFRALILLLVLRRGGLLSLAVALFYMFSLIEVPITLDVGAWYAPRALPVVGVLVALALYGFRTSLGGKPVFGSSLLDD
jgi:hypothetical protein